MKTSKNFTVCARAHELPIGAGRVLVAGDLAFASFGKVAQAPRDYVAQVPRDAAGNLWQQITRTGPKVSLSVHPALIRNQRMRVGFLLDAYLAWGRKKAKGKVVLIGCLPSSTEIFVDVLVFADGRLTDLTDRSLPAHPSQDFDSAARLMVQSIKEQYLKASDQNARVVIAGLIDDPHIPETEFIGNQPVKYVRYRSVYGPTQTDRSALWPLGVLAGSAVFYAGAIGLAWSRNEAAKDDYDRAAKAPEIAKRGGMDAGYVGVMTQRRLFMQAQRGQVQLAQSLVTVVRGVSAVPDVKIQELRLPGKKEGDAKPADVDLKVTVPKVGATALGQGQDLVASLAKNTGLSWKSAGKDWKEEGARRTFALQGNANGK